MYTRSARSKFSRKLLTTAFFCFLILFIGFYTANVIRMSFLRHEGTIPMFEEMAFFSKPANDPLIDIVVIAISTFSMLFAGFVSAASTNKNGWLSGWITGAIWSLSYSVVLVLYLMNGISVANLLGSPEFIQKNFTQDVLNNYIATIPSDFLKSILLCGIGGTIYDFIRRMRQSKGTEKVEAYQPTKLEDIMKHNY